MDLGFVLKFCNIWRPAAIMAATEFDFATLLGDQAKSVDELAALTNTQPGWVYRLLKSLSIEGIFAEEDGYFHNTPASKNLRSDNPDSVRNVVLLLGTSYFKDGFAQLSKIVKTGLSGPHILNRPPYYQHLQEHKEENTLFENAIASLADVANDTISTSYPFPAGVRVVDVGGGLGNLPLTIQKHHPTIKPTLFDLPAAIDLVRQKEHAFPSGLALVAGDIFEDRLPEADIYLFRDVYHCFSDDDCRKIIVNCQESMPPSSKILVIEQAFDVPALMAGIDLLMGVVFEGKQRSDQEWKSLFTPLVLSRRFTTESPFVIWEFTSAS